MPLLWALLAATAAAQTEVCATGPDAVVPPNQIGQPYAKYQTKCRGAPLLANVANGLRVVAVDAPATLARRDATDDGMHYGHGHDDWTLPDDPARDVGSTHVALVAKLYRLIYRS